MSTNQRPEVVIKFEPSPNFDEEFLEFAETVLSWSREEKLTSKPDNYANRRKNNPKP